MQPRALFPAAAVAERYEIEEGTCAPQFDIFYPHTPTRIGTFSVNNALTVTHGQ